MVSESPDTIVCYSLRLFRVCDEILDFLFEVGEVSFDFDEVLVGAIGSEEVVMVLDPLHFVDEDYGVADLSVF